ncbi:MAG: hypothetical protein WD847_00430 [Pirellulales bacterium]
MPQSEPAIESEALPDAEAEEVRPLWGGLGNLRITWAAIPEPLDLMPPPANPNMLFGNEIREPPGVAALVYGLPIVLDSKASLRVDTAYDTGFVGSGIRLLPSTIALDGTKESRRQGQFQLGAQPSQLKFAAVAPNGRYRGDAEIHFFDTAEIRQLKGQVALPSSDVIYGGFTWTTFMDEYAVPISMIADATSAGTVFRRQAQLGYFHVLNELWSLSAAIEHGPNDDFTLVNTGDERLRRWPDLVLRLRWGSSPDPRVGSSLHVATLLRSIGREDVTFVEDFTTGWGISVMMKAETWDQNHLFVGFVGGEGIGSYIFGFTPDKAAPPDNMPAAGPLSGNLTALANHGAHIGYQHVWCPDWSQSNIGFGYAYAETTAAMPVTAARRLKNAWINHQWRINPAISLGVEYHYADREVRSGLDGDNHRIMVVTQFLN